MSYREERVAKNEATSRVINEGVEAAYESEPQDEFLFFICECGLEQCDRTVRITKAVYERVRNDPRQFVIFRGRLAVRRAPTVPTSAISVSQHPDQHRPQRPVLLAVDQQLGGGATLWVAPECSDPTAQPSSRRNARGVLSPR
jgi:hypothetical protein